MPLVDRERIGVWWLVAKPAGSAIRVCRRRAFGSQAKLQSSDRRVGWSRGPLPTPGDLGGVLAPFPPAPSLRGGVRARRGCSERPVGGTHGGTGETSRGGLRGGRVVVGGILSGFSSSFSAPSVHIRPNMVAGGAGVRTPASGPSLRSGRTFDRLFVAVGHGKLDAEDEPPYKDPKDPKL